MLIRNSGKKNLLRPPQTNNNSSSSTSYSSDLSDDSDSSLRFSTPSHTPPNSDYYVPSPDIQHSPYTASTLTTEGVNDNESDDEEKEEETTNSEWFEFEDVLIHIASFIKGVIVIKPVGSDEISHFGKQTSYHDMESSVSHLDELMTKEDPIIVKDRQIYFSQANRWEANAEPNSHIKKAFNLLSKITRFGNPKRYIHVVAELPHPATVSKDAFVLIKTTYKLELYYKISEETFNKIGMPRAQLLKILHSINVSEVLKKQMPFKLQLNSGAFEILENTVLLYRQLTLAIVKQMNGHVFPAQCRFILTKNQEIFELSQRLNGSLIKFNIKPCDLQTYLNNIGITEALLSKTEDSLTLNSHQLDSLEQLAVLMGRSVYLDSSLHDHVTQADHDYVLIKKPAAIDLYIEQKTEHGQFYQMLTATELEIFTQESRLFFSMPCYVKDKEGHFSLVDLNNVATRRQLLKQSELVLYFEDANGHYTQIQESSNQLKSHLVGLTKVLQKKPNGSYEPIKISLKEIEKLLSQEEYELHYKNLEGELIKVLITSSQLKKYLTEFDMLDQIHRKSAGQLILTNQQLERIDNLINLYTCVTAYNQQRRDEVFVSVPSVGLYVQPWLSKNNSEDQFKPHSGFQRFHTVGCLFGSTLRGVDELKRKFPLVKHDICFHDNEVGITSISFNPKALNPYEEMLFIEQDKIAKFINLYAQRSDFRSEPFLSYHLPYIDYVLFGLSLLAIGRITFDALEKLFIVTFQQKDKHIQIVKKIYQQYGICVEFESPFENLFDLKLLDKEFRNATATKGKSVKHSFTKAILKMLYLSEDDFQHDPKRKKATENSTGEKILTRRLLELLINNNNNSKHKRAWKDFAMAAEKNSAEEIQKLQNIAAKMLRVLHAEPENKEAPLEQIYQEVELLCATNKSSLKELEASYHCALETKDAASTTIFLNQAFEIKKTQAITTLYNQVAPLAVTQNEVEDIENKFNEALAEKTESSITALLAFGINKKEINCIEDIFKIGNSVMVGLTTLATTGDFQSCSILPVSEKQIQLHYDKLKKTLPESKETTYHGIVNLTYMPTAVCADNTDRKNAGLFFYYGGDQAESIARVMKMLTKYAAINMALYAHSKSQKYGEITQQYVSLEQALLSHMTDSPVLTSMTSTVDSTNYYALRNI